MRKRARLMMIPVLLIVAIGASTLAAFVIIQRFMWYRRVDEGIASHIRLPPLETRKGTDHARFGGTLFERLSPVVRQRMELMIEGRPQTPITLGFWTVHPSERVNIQSLIEGALPGCQVSVLPSSGTVPSSCDDALWMSVYEIRPNHRRGVFRLFGESDSIGPLIVAHRPPSDIMFVRTQILITPTYRSIAAIRRRAWLRARSLMQREKYRERNADVRRMSKIAQSAMYQVTLRIIVVGQTSEATKQAAEHVASVVQSVTMCSDAIRPSSLRVTRRVTRQMERLSRMKGAPALIALLSSIGSAIIGGITGYAMFASFFNAAPEGLSELALMPLIGSIAFFGFWGLIALDMAERSPVMTIMRAINRLHDRRPFLLSSAELATIWDASPSADFDRIPNRFLPPPEIAFQRQGDLWIALGEGRRSDGTYAPIGIPLRDMRQVLHITAGMGAGKSRLLANIVDQIGRMPVGMGIIDGKGDDQGSLAWLTLDLLPMEREKDIVFLYPIDHEWPIALNPLQSSDPDPQGRVNQLLALLSRLDAGGWSRSHGMEQYAMHAGILVAEGEPHPTLMHVKRALIDDAYRQKLLPLIRNPETIAFWREIYPAQGKAQRTSIDALVRRIDKVLVPDIIRWVFTSPEPTVDITRVMETTRILIAPLPSERMGGIAYAFGTLLTRMIVLGAFLRQGEDRNRADWPLIIDEVQVLLDQTGGNDDFRTMLSRLRSLGVPGIYAHQALAQLGDLAPDMLVNASNRVILRTTNPDSETYARRYAAFGLTPGDISRQDPLEHQYFDLMANGRSTGLFSGRPLPWPRSTLPTLDPIPNASWKTVRAKPLRTPQADRIDDMVEKLMSLDPYTPCLLDDCAHFASTISDDDWRDICERWKEHRIAQREALLATPNLEPEHRKRRRLISSLLYGRPIAQAIIDYLRIRNLSTAMLNRPRSFAPSAYLKTAD